MTDNEIIKALECCAKTRDYSECEKIRCPLFRECKIEYKSMEGTIIPYSLDLITRQKAEIERLRKFLDMSRKISLARRYENIRKDELMIKMSAECKTAKAEAIKRCIEKVKQIIGEMVDIMFDDNVSKCKIKNCRYPSNIPCGNKICIEENKTFWSSKIDNIAKEMVGED